MKTVTDLMTGIIAHHHAHSGDSGGKGRVKTLPGLVTGSGMRCYCMRVKHSAFHCCCGYIAIEFFSFLFYNAFSVTRLYSIKSLLKSINATLEVVRVNS
jgi:hypothetical protein